MNAQNDRRESAAASVRELVAGGRLVEAARREAEAAERDGYYVTADLLEKLAREIEALRGDRGSHAFDRLREAWLDFGFQVLKALGIVALVQRLGWKLKPWAQEREARDDR